MNKAVMSVIEAYHDASYEVFIDMLKDLTYRPTTSEVLPLAHKIHRRNGDGCCLHVILDDGNVEDDNGFCIELARERGHKDCEILAILLSKMFIEQRRIIYKMWLII